MDESKQGRTLPEGTPVFRCCTPAAAWAWVDTLADEALTGDSLSRRLLPMAIKHALIIEREAQA